MSEFTKGAEKNLVQVQDGKVFTQVDGLQSVLTMSEFWNLKKSGHAGTKSIRLLGFGAFEIHLDLDRRDRLQIALLVISDGEKCISSDFTAFQLGYVAQDDFVIPLKGKGLDLLAAQLAELQSSLPDVIEVALSRLMKISIQHALTLSYSDRVEEYLESFPFEPIQSATSVPLWEYQTTGLSWMMRLWRAGLGGILGDEMGVGKTLQLLALTCTASTIQTNKPFLVVVPGNLLLKWCKDFIQFAPEFAENVYVHHGSDRSKNLGFLSKQQIILTTYSMVVEDESVFRLIDFEIICCDEAHELKEPRTLRSQAIRSLSAKAKFLATGTPIQNRLLDYWTLIDIADPGMLGRREDFEFSVENTPSDARRLAEMTKHRILRRTQAQLEIEIPPGTEFSVPLALEFDEMIEYREFELEAGSSGHGLLTNKRQFCAHPSSFDVNALPLKGQKAYYLRDQISQINELGEKAVVFVADFNRPRDLYRQLVEEHFPDIWAGTIDGRTEVGLRHVILEEFETTEGCAVLFVNPTVGGQGLDMVAANHVFHMNPAWNPAKTDQATFRVNRPGQTRETWSHHLFFDQTIESSIVQLVSEKRELSESALTVAELESNKNQTSQLQLLKNEGKRGKHVGRV